MAAVEEHKPVEKRRALGRGLDSLLPSGPRVVTSSTATAATPARTGVSEPHGSSVVPPPVVVTTAVAPVVAEPGPELVPSPVPGEIAELHAAREQPPLKPTAGLTRPPVVSEGSRTGVSAPHGQFEPHTQENVVLQIPLDLIDENPYQTRRAFDEGALKELAESIKATGVAQPVVVRPSASGRYVLVLGERRCRASKLAGKATVPAIVRTLGNEQAAEMTIVENLQRQDLNCLEQAEAFARLSKEFRLTQEQIGQRTGVSRESVANYLRMLKLPKPVLELIGQGKLGFSEARVLLEAAPHVSAQVIIDLASTAVRLDLTVRNLKERVDMHLHPELHRPEPPKPKTVDPNVQDAERQLREALGMRVRVMSYQGNKGQVVIRYESLADFDRILDRLSRDV